MTLQCTTVEEIDQLVYMGNALGQLTPNDSPTDVPPTVGDWMLRLAPGADSTSTVVALPTGRRTRAIYNQGRINWLKKLGYTEELADTYFKASNPIMYRWEELVALFVLENQNMTMDTWDALHKASNLKIKAKELGIHNDLTQARMAAGLQILINIWELSED